MFKKNAFWTLSGRHLKPNTMKNILLASFILLLSLGSFSQQKKIENIKIKYKILIHEDALPDPSANPQVRARWEGILQSIPSLEFILNADQESYLFSASDIMNSDFYRAQRSALITVGGDRTYYKDDKVKIVNKNFLGESFNINIKDYEWTITDETKEILGYSCYKAVSEFTTIDPNGEDMKVSVVAWFAPEINISGGPLGMDNLPGIVLEAAESERFSYSASKIDFSPGKKVEWKKMPHASKTVEESEYQNLVKKTLAEIKARG